MVLIKNYSYKIESVKVAIISQIQYTCTPFWSNTICWIQLLLSPWVRYGNLFMIKYFFVIGLWYHGCIVPCYPVQIWTGSLDQISYYFFSFSLYNI